MNYTYSESFGGLGAWGEALKRVMARHNDTCELKWYAEIDKYASNAFAAIHEVSEELNIWDITKDIIVEAMDIFFYSPPCQTFSIAGKREGTTVAKGNLFYEAAKFIKQTQPKYAIMENVKGLPTGDTKKDFYAMLQYLEEIGYHNDWAILNTKDYGIPQNRERVFVVSIRQDLYDKGKRFYFPKPFKLELDLDTITSDFPNPEYALKLEELEKVLFDIEDLKNFTEYADYRYDEGLRVRQNRISPCLLASAKPTDISGMPLKIIKVISNTKCGYEIAKPGDSINLDFLGSNTRRGRVGKGVSQTLMTQGNMAVYKGYGVFKLSPLHFFKLQGFTEAQYIRACNNFKNSFDKSELQLKREMYKRGGNSITVNVIEEILENLLYDRKQEGQQLSLF